MMFAIPYQNERISGHFTRAERFLFTDKKHSISKDNPALVSGGCSGKKSLFTLLKNQKTDAVLIRNIGQKMLAKLLNANIRVFRTSSHVSIETLQLSELTELTELTEVSQGRPCKSKKQRCCSQKTAVNRNVSTLTAPNKINNTFTVLGLAQ